MPQIATSFQNPMAGIQNYWVSQPYNGTNTIISGFHSGVDYSSAAGDGDLGDNIRSAGNGTVVYAGYHSASWGNVVMIRHTLPNGTYVTTLYGHLDSILVASGDVVMGQVIGTIGDARAPGSSNGPYDAHLHFSVFLGALTAVPRGYTTTADSTPTSNGFVDPVWFLNGYSSNGLVLHGTLGNDSGRNAIHGGAGDDVIFDGNGADTIYGGVGNDYLSATGSNDVDLYNGGSGTDWVSYANLLGPVTINLVTKIVTGTNTGTDTLVSIENAQGSKGDDTITGNSLANILDGREGKDTLDGGAGNDDLVGLKGNDTLIGGTGIDRARYDYDHDGNGAIHGIEANLATGIVIDTVGFTDTLSSIENISGSIYADKIYGNSLSNELSGNGENDTLGGRGGNDRLIGGAGADKFVFDTALDASTNVDTVVDFNHFQDDFNLSKSIFSIIGTTLSVGEFKVGTAALDSNDYVIYDQSTGSLYYDSNGSGTGRQILFAKVTAGTTLTYDDFALI